jgi:hypothetical protein
VCGFAVGVLSIVPGLKNFTCCLLVPIAAGAALYFDQRINGRYVIPSSQGAMFGVATGFAAALFNVFFDLIITYIFRTNEFIGLIPEVEKLYHSFQLPPDVYEQAVRILRGIETKIAATGFSLFYAIFLLINSMLSNIVFGLIGGLAWASYLNKRVFSDGGN